jgi:hypothetical protein
VVHRPWQGLIPGNRQADPTPGNGSALLLAEAGEHDLNCFQPFRGMDEIMVANFMLFQEVVGVGGYELVIATRRGTSAPSPRGSPPQASRTGLVHRLRRLPADA